MTLHTYSGSNICGILIDHDAFANKVYFCDSDCVKIYAPDYKTFEQFPTKEDAALRARAIDPSFNLNKIFGTFLIEPLNVTGMLAPADRDANFEPSYGTYIPHREDGPVTNSIDLATFEGTALTINSEYTYSSGVITYSWKKDGHPIPNATNSSLVFSNPLTEMSGTYSCHVVATASNGTTGEEINNFNLTVHKLPS